MQDGALWQRRLGYRFDASTGPDPFSAKPARTEGWTAKVIEECRTFLCLSQVSRQPETVDRPWHLTYTRDCWNTLCARVLHHEPSRGGEESQPFNRQNQQTRMLDLDAQEFGRMPPRDDWPDVATPGAVVQLPLLLVMAGSAAILGGTFGNGLPSPLSGSLILGGVAAMAVGFRIAAPRFRRSRSRTCRSGGDR